MGYVFQSSTKPCSHDMENIGANCWLCKNCGYMDASQSYSLSPFEIDLLTNIAYGNDAYDRGESTEAERYFVLAIKQASILQRDEAQGKYKSFLDLSKLAASVIWKSFLLKYQIFSFPSGGKTTYASLDPYFSRKSIVGCKYYASLTKLSDYNQRVEKAVDAVLSNKKYFEISATWRKYKAYICIDPADFGSPEAEELYQFLLEKYTAEEIFYMPYTLQILKYMNFQEEQHDALLETCTMFLVGSSNKNIMATQDQWRRYLGINKFNPTKLRTIVPYPIGGATIEDFPSVLRKFPIKKGPNLGALHYELMFRGYLPDYRSNVESDIDALILVANKEVRDPSILIKNKERVRQLNRDIDVLKGRKRLTKAYRKKLNFLNLKYKVQRKNYSKRIASIVMICILCAGALVGGGFGIGAIVRGNDTAAYKNLLELGSAGLKYEYSTDLGGWVVSRGTADVSGEIVIPHRRYNENGTVYEVKAIAELGFSGAAALTGIVIPRTVISIGQNAFQNTKIATVYENGVAYLKPLANSRYYQYRFDEKSGYAISIWQLNTDGSATKIS